MHSELFIVLGGLLFMAYPQAAESTLVNGDSDGWSAGAVAYVVLSLVMLAWYGGWQAGSERHRACWPEAAGPRPEWREQPVARAAVIRNSPQVLAGFGELTGNNSPERQGFHDRLAGGTYVVRPAP